MQTRISHTNLLSTSVFQLTSDLSWSNVQGGVTMPSNVKCEGNMIDGRYFAIEQHKNKQRMRS